MSWDIEYTDEFEIWWDGLDESEQVSVATVVGLLEEKGTHLSFPYSSKIFGSRYTQIRELRIQHRGEPYRILYAFDPKRTALLLLGGKKTGQERWYMSFIPIADRLFDEHLDRLNKGAL